MKLRKRLLPPVVSLYTMVRCLFIFLNIDTNAIIKMIDFFDKKPKYITYDYLYPNISGYWKKHLLRPTRLFMFSWYFALIIITKQHCLIHRTYFE